MIREICTVVLSAALLTGSAAAVPPAHLVKDVATPPLQDYPSPPLVQMVELGGHVYFAASDGASGIELWRTDGSAGGTELVADLCPGVRGSWPRELTPHRGPRRSPQ